MSPQYGATCVELWPPKYAPLSREDVAVLLEYLANQWLPYPIAQAYDRVRKEAGL